MLDLETALARILARIPLLPAETVPLAAARGRVLRENLVAPLDLPPFDNSAMDGYAVRAADVAGVTPERPGCLSLRGIIPAGKAFAGELHAGECIRIFTGSPLPAGADAVVMQEDTHVDASRPGVVMVLDPVKPWENVRFQGEDVKRGTTLPGRGARLDATHVGLLAALGLAGAPVSRTPRVGVLATGSELVEPGQPLAPGQVYESNRVLLSGLLTRAGAEPRIFPLVPDTLEGTQAALERAFAECDAVVTSGGVSVGEFDFVKAAFENSGGQLDLWKVAIRPGKPFVFGERAGKFLFGLPGNPVSGFVTFLLLVRPALLRWQGMDEVALPVQAGVLGEPLQNRGDRRHFVRVRRAHDGKVTLAGPQASHRLRALAEANGLVDVPPQVVLSVGTNVDVLAWGD